MCQGSRVTKSAFVRQFCIFVFKTTSRNPSSLPSVPKCRSTESTTAKTRKKIRGQNSHQKATKRLLKGMTWLVTLLLYYLLIAMSKKENEPCLEPCLLLWQKSLSPGPVFASLLLLQPNKKRIFSFVSNLCGCFPVATRNPF